jgi:hypothetical protein
MGFKSGADKLSNKLEVELPSEQLKLSYDASNNTTFSVSSAGIMTATPSGGVFGVSGMLAYKQYIVETKANGATMAANESGGLVFQTTGTTTPGDTVVSLPATATGLVYTFVWLGAAGSGFHISPNASDRIAGSLVDVANGNAVTAGDTDGGGAGNVGRGIDNKDLILKTGSKVGDRVTLVADGTDGWVILDALGNWDFES